MDTYHLQMTFHAWTNAAPEVLVWSPGRVNLIGDHTDYNDGWALPMTLEMGTLIAARARADDVLHTWALRMNEQDNVPLTALQPNAAPMWVRYVRGVAALLQAEGYRIPGANLLIDSTLPLRSGLSSSASLEMGVSLALLTLAKQTMDRRTMARLCQRVEHEIIGVRSGLLDQLAVGFGEAGHALLLDCRTLEIQIAPLPENARIVVIDSAVPRTLASSGYNQRRSECAAALQKLQQVDPTLQALRDVSPELLATEQGRLSAVEQRRVRHVVSENARTFASYAALQTGDSKHFGALMNESHASLRDDYESSAVMVDVLVDIAQRTTGVLGARITGGGFGGCVVVLVEAAAAASAQTHIVEQYATSTGYRATAYQGTAGAGLGTLS
ncbi:MAG: galactokinase [Chloroflexaceae bacterium]|nr:galactokinase [Chloroflexaceae bacterium]